MNNGNCNKFAEGAAHVLWDFTMEDSDQQGRLWFIYLTILIGPELPHPVKVLGIQRLKHEANP